MLELNESNDRLEGELKLSDCESEFVVRWLSGSSQASFFIGDAEEVRSKIKSFISGKKYCYINLPAYLSYLKNVEHIVKKYKSMYYGPFNHISNIYARFSSMKQEDAKVVLSYDYPERYIRILNDKKGYKDNVLIYGEETLKNGDDFRHSYIGGITKIVIDKKDNDHYQITVQLIENWREILMKENGAKVKLESIIDIFNTEMYNNISSGKTEYQSGQIFGIKYAPLLERNKTKFTYQEIVKGSNYNKDDVLKAVELGITISSDVIWSPDLSKDLKNDSIDNNFNVFGIHITKQNSALDTNNPHICIGWSNLGDLSSISSKEELYNFYATKNPEHSNQRKGANVSQIWMFKDEIKVNDYVVYFDKGIAHVGKVIGEYEYIQDTPSQDLDYVNNRRVEWIKDIAYKDLPSEYRKSSMTQKSVFRLSSYKPLVQDIISGNELYVDEFDNVEDETIDKQELLPIFDFKKSQINDGTNLIVYGTPGCGKSYYVQHTLLKDWPTTNYIRTTFFQDYTNTDFVGQILPVVEGEKVTYKFNPGPFTLALELAIRKPDERIALVIEELNRGSAASIFGDIFQLLDRKEGVSEYSITNVNIINYLKEKFEGEYTFDNIRLPGNLSIYATMNTSDQNVFTLDTAFKRRWKFKKLLNKFESNHKFKDMYIPGADITWKDFVNGINKFILESPTGLNSEDKQLGVYFVDEKGMRKETVDVSDPKAVEDFAYKVLEYLWTDVAKFDRSKWFTENIKSLDDLVDEYKAKGIGAFNYDVFNK